MSFKILERQAIATFDICPNSPLIISNGKNNVINPTLPSTTFLTGMYNNQETFVIPGSSIKGVIRHSFYDRYIDDVLINQLFGNIDNDNKNCKSKGKVQFFDAYANMSTIRTTIRYNTAIDKTKQSAKNTSLNSIQTIVDGTFKASFKLTNYSERELEEIMLSLIDFNEGNISIGGRSSRGFGRITIKNFMLTINLGYDKNFNPKVETFNSPQNVIEHLRELVVS